MLLKTSGVVRLTEDVTMRYTPGGDAVASFSVASSEKFKTKDGKQDENTTFIKVTAFGRLGEICNEFLSRGSQIYIIGKLKLDQWTAQDGNKRSAHSITLESMEMLGGKADTNSSNPPNHEEQVSSESKEVDTDINDDDIPF